MPQLDSYIFFNGDCAEAMAFYHRILGGTLEPMMKYGDAPPQPGGPQTCPPGDVNRVMHTALHLGDRMIMASDLPAAQDGQAAQRFALSLTYEAPAEARRIFDALAAGGAVMMPMGETFWSEAFGMFTDRFGTHWMVGGGAKKQQPA